MRYGMRAATTSDVTRSEPLSPHCNNLSNTMDFPDLGNSKGALWQHHVPFFGSTKKQHIRLTLVRNGTVFERFDCLVHGRTEPLRE